MDSVRATQGQPAVIVAGAVDAAGRDGVAVDVAWLARLGVRAGLVVTAVEGHALGQELVETQLARALESLGSTVRVLRTGYVADPVHCGALVRTVRERGLALVVDPLLGAQGAHAAAILLPLLKHAALVTPNVAEAVALGGEPWDGTRDGLLALARALAGPERTAAVTGGALAGARVTTAIAGPGGEQLVDAPRADRGTLCGAGAAFAAAAAGYVALGLPPFDAAAAAHRLVSRAVLASSGIDRALLVPEPWSV